MSEPDDLDLRPADPPDDQPPEPQADRLDDGFPFGLLAAGVATVAVLAGLGYFAWRVVRRVPPPPVSAAVAPTPTPDATPSAAVQVPPLDASDAFVRELLKGLSAHPRLSAWLDEADLVRRFVSAVTDVARGRIPRAHLGFLAPSGPFGVLRRGSAFVVDPRSYARYDGVADVVESLDAAACARVYRVLTPLLEAAHKELADTPGSFDAHLRAAVEALHQVPVLEGDVLVRPSPRVATVYEYVDPQLESLSAAQKQLLRFGPRNVRRMQGKLRDLQAALGS